MDKKRYSYNQIHASIAAMAQDPKLQEFKPTMILAIGGGGFIPARILRTFLKQATGKSIGIQAIGLALYEDDSGDSNVLERPVRKTQWMTYGSEHEAAVLLQGHRILIVDEVDDTRKTLAYAVEELLKDIAAERSDFLANHSSKVAPVGPVTPGGLTGEVNSSPANGSQQQQQQQQERVAAAPAAAEQEAAAAAAAGWQEPRLGVFVVHNKLKPKLRELPEGLMNSAYFAAAHIPDQWVVYPWDALDIWEHTQLAENKAENRSPLAELHAQVF